MGKGHRALETFCMVMNMKPMNHRSYFSHIIALHKEFREEVDLSLVSARNEVRKCYGEIDNSGNNVGLIGITVSYDGTWQKRGFTSKYGIGCCIEVLTGLVIDFEVLSKFCNLCDKMKRKTKGRPQDFQGKPQAKLQPKLRRLFSRHGSRGCQATLAAIGIIWVSIYHYGVRW